MSQRTVSLNLKSNISSTDIKNQYLAEKLKTINSTKDIQIDSSKEIKIHSSQNLSVLQDHSSLIQDFSSKNIANHAKLLMTSPLKSKFTG